MSAARNYIRKRRVPRRSFHRNIGILVRGNYLITEAQELGEGGMLILSPVPLEEGQKLVVSFSIPGLIHVVVRAVVRYSKKLSENKKDAYGVQFENIDFDARRQIRTFVAMKSADELN